ncbi:YgjV family protein [Azospirillum sp. TSH100]|uniref:YgjV family protein n=1 Tax=Azospirillum sp. TSH100 TaxID=652764 RepID=UPI001FFF6741|nr:YgjV family protein [Azospirillum sp. TSH100]
MAQLLGFCGTIGGMLWPFFHSRTAMLLVQLVPCLCFALHFALVDAPTAAALNGLAAIQVLAALAVGGRAAFRIAYLLILPVIAVVMALTWTGLPSAFAAAGMALISLARYQTQVARFRGTMLVALPCWFVHNSLVGSVPGMISDLTGIVVNAWMLLRGTGMAPPQPAPLATPIPSANGEAKLS